MAPVFVLGTIQALREGSDMADRPSARMALWWHALAAPSPKILDAVSQMPVRVGAGELIEEQAVATNIAPLAGSSGDGDSITYVDVELVSGPPTGGMRVSRIRSRSPYLAGPHW